MDAPEEYGGVGLNDFRYNMIIGAKGSPLQLVLNSVYLISKPIENISWQTYEQFLPANSDIDGLAVQVERLHVDEQVQDVTSIDVRQ